MSKVIVKKGDVWFNYETGLREVVTAVGTFNVLIVKDLGIEVIKSLDDNLFNSPTCGVLKARDGEPVESETLLDRIKAQYPDFEVVMLDFWENTSLPNSRDYLGFRDDAKIKHIDAQSMKGFYEYVYICQGIDDGEMKVYTLREPTDSLDALQDLGTIHPVAALFSRGES